MSDPLIPEQYFAVVSTIVDTVMASPRFTGWIVSALLMIPVLVSLAKWKKRVNLETNPSFCVESPVLEETREVGEFMLRKNKKKKNKETQMNWLEKTKVVLTGWTIRLSPFFFLLFQIYRVIILKNYYWVYCTVHLAFFWFRDRSMRKHRNYYVPSVGFLNTVSFVSNTLYNHWSCTDLFVLMSPPSSILQNKENSATILYFLIKAHVNKSRVFLNVTMNNSLYFKLVMLHQLFLFWGLAVVYHPYSPQHHQLGTDDSKEEITEHSLRFIEQLLYSFGGVPMMTAKIQEIDSVPDSVLLKIAIPILPKNCSMTPNEIEKFPIRVVHKRTGEIITAGLLPLLTYLQNGPGQCILSEIDYRVCRMLPRLSMSIDLFCYQSDSPEFADYALELEQNQWYSLHAASVNSLNAFKCYHDHSASWRKQLEGKGSQEETTPERWVSVTVFAAIARLDMATPCFEFVYRFRSTS